MAALPSDPIHVPATLTALATEYRTLADTIEAEFENLDLAGDWRCVADMLDECARHMGSQLAIQRMLKRHMRRYGEPASTTATAILSMAASIAAGGRP